MVCVVHYYCNILPWYLKASHLRGANIISNMTVPWYHLVPWYHTMVLYVHVYVPWYWLDALTAPEPGEQVPSQDDHPWNPQTRTATETVLREAMQALVRVQAHVLARIVVEIRAADIAVELEPQL
jgi:hypothetical protein